MQSLVTQMRQIGIWPTEVELQRTVEDLGRRLTDGRALARELIQRQILTPFQANLLLTGKGQTLSLGPYVLLERLGEGGMGQVYKAWHRRLHKIVALKIIKPEKVSNPVAVRRFFREIQGAARLSHPNIVWAMDADQDGSVYYLAMQFIPGMDLSRLVKQLGPLDYRQACDYIRQAALGLQHIAQNAMVHRDVKPSNILIALPPKSNEQAASGVALGGSPYGTVKIVDLGLMRLADYEEEATRRDTKLTHLGTVMGTVDYMAPEQARDSHQADIRSDIYSLGCTLYFALAGQAPFKGSGSVEKILQHQMEEPFPVDKLRNDLPPALVGVLGRMMAKRPEDRFQTPLEVARALEPFCQAAVAQPLEAVPVAQVLQRTMQEYQTTEMALTPLIRVSPTLGTYQNNAGIPAHVWLKIAALSGGAILGLLILLRLLIR